MVCLLSHAELTDEEEAANDEEDAAEDAAEDEDEAEEAALEAAEHAETASFLELAHSQLDASMAAFRAENGECPSLPQHHMPPRPVCCAG
jgi:hypothetical protein